MIDSSPLPESYERSETPRAEGKWKLNREDFDTLLTWLHPDREEAGRRYEQIRRGLIKMFKCRGSVWAEELANETFDRVCRKIRELAPRYEGEPAPYVYAVANNIYLESLKKKQPSALPPELASEPTEDVEQKHECLDECLGQLEVKDRSLALDYYRADKKGKIDNRKTLARQYGITQNALRLKMFGLRRALYRCIIECLARKLAD